MSEDVWETSGSTVADAFVAAVASQVGDGAARNVHQAAECFSTENAAPQAEVARLRLLTERATFDWAGQALRQAGEDGSADGLESLRGNQASYIAALIKDRYISDLSDAGPARITCEEARSALLVADHLEDASATPLETGGTHGGEALAACFATGALNSVVDEAVAVLETLFSDPLPATAVIWDGRE